MPHDIFVSYSRRDLATVKSIKEELEAAGFSCWMDIDGIESGVENFKRKIVPALDRCKVVLFFISSDSQQSEWTDKELGYAKRHGKRVVPLRFNDDPLVGEFDFDYGSADTIDWRAPEQKEKLLKDLRSREDGRSGESPSQAEGRLPADSRPMTPTEREINDHFRTIVRDGSVNRFSGPCFNLVLPTRGGRVFWYDLSVVDGWKFQTNRFFAQTLFDNCRILDPKGMRIAWGLSQRSMLKALRIHVQVRKAVLGLRAVPRLGISLSSLPTTQSLWTAVAGKNPSRVKDGSFPVTNVSFTDVRAFLKKLNRNPLLKTEGIRFRLPTVDEWDFACRAGSAGDWGLLASGAEGNPGELAWTDENSGGSLHAVGTKSPNAWGFYDMHGNVFEWTSTPHGDHEYFTRGGAWNFPAGQAAAGVPGWSEPGFSDDNLGFRLCTDRGF